MPDDKRLVLISTIALMSATMVLCGGCSRDDEDENPCSVFACRSVASADEPIANTLDTQTSSTYRSMDGEPDDGPLFRQNPPDYDISDLREHIRGVTSNYPSFAGNELRHWSDITNVLFTKYTNDR